MKRFDVDYFSRIYERSDDPWGFENSWYEQRKYALTLAAIPRERYATAFEPGCSFGVLSEMLAPRCESLICYELVPRVASRARQRLSGYEHVQVDVGAIPGDWPDTPLELVVLSEVAYYLTDSGIEAIARNVHRTLVPGGHVVAVHYRKETDYPLSGDDASEALAGHLADCERLATFMEPSFRIDVFERRT